jgi:radical SAM superfamily enzyme YgiQ (UPF0313 family)
LKVVLATVPTPGQRVRRGESLGLRYLAAVAIAGGHDVHIREATDSDTDPAVFAEEIVALRPDMVGLGVQFSKQAVSTARVADAIRARTTVPLIVGGQALNFAWREMMDLSPSIDVSVCFEADEVFPELLAWVASGRANSEPPRGLFVRTGSEISTTGFRDPVIELDALPFPVRDEASGAYGQPNYSVLTSRGCQSGCTFCSSGNFGNRYHSLPRWRARSANNVLSEMRELVERHGARAISVVDDDFLGGNALEPAGMKRAIAIAHAMASLPAAVKFSIELRADEMLNAPIEELKRAGLSHVFIGLDGATEFDLKLYAKRVHLPVLTDAVQRVRDCGLTASYGVIMFNPLTTIQRLRESVEQLHALDVLTSDHLVNRLSVYRGSPLISYFQKQDIKLEWNYDTFEYAYSLPQDVAAILQAFRDLASEVKPLELEITRATFRLATGIDVDPDDRARHHLDELAGLAHELRAESRHCSDAAARTTNAPCRRGVSVNNASQAHERPEH